MKTNPNDPAKKSRQSTEKQTQNYRDKPVFPMCSNCKHFNMDIVQMDTRWGNYTKEQNLRCKIGEFAVKKQGTCDLHEFAALNESSTEK